MSEIRVLCPATLDQITGKEVDAEVRKRKLRPEHSLVLDLAGTKEMDTLGGAWLVEIAQHCHKRGAKFRCEGSIGKVAEVMEIVEPALTPAVSAGAHDMGVLENLGGKAISETREVRDFFELCIDAFYWTLIAPLERKGFRWGLMVDELHEMGVRAVRIVCMMNFLLGLIIAMLSSAQVSSFGLSIYVADLIMIGFARELAAVMTSTVVSARTGAAIAAELATMKVQEEIDALRGMGLNVTQFLVAPKVAALVIVLPCLSAIGLLCGVLGGAVWGVVILGFRPAVWFNQTVGAIDMGDLFQGTLKSFVFAIAIALIGCHNGLRVTGGSRGVGLMTTRAVVMDIFVMICIDIIFAAIFYYILG